MSAPNSLRYIPVDFAPGPLQLARTEAIMEAVAAGSSPPTLRLYSWSEPVVILGTGQQHRDLDLDSCRSNGFRILRRTGGGTAVFHDHDELSIDLIVPETHSLTGRDVHAGYELFAGLLADALGKMGISVDTVSIESARAAQTSEEMRPICFASVSPYEFEAGGRKLNGLCQIRRRNAIAFQSAIYRRFRIDPLLASLVHESELVRQARESALRHRVTDLATLAGGEFDYDRFGEVLARIAGDKLGLSLHRDALYEAEMQRASRLADEKFEADAWTFRR